jgi:SAM-dependent methyltransferase
LLLAIAGFWILFRRIILEPLPIEIAVFLHLFLTVGAVAIYLAMASPLLQIAIEADGRIDAHRLYAWSNAGSLLGLVLYPTIMETFVPLRFQMGIWLVIASAAALLIHRTVSRAAANGAAQQIHWQFPGRARVMFISAVAGALTIAVTARLTLDLGALPLLWVLPLIVLLLSYIVAFGKLAIQRSLTAAAPLALAITCYVFFNGAYMAPLELIVLWCGLVFVVQCGLQSRLRELAPTGGARGAYYVALATGGFAGSLIVGCLLPYSWKAIALVATAAPVIQPLLQTDPIPELGWCLVAAAFALVGAERWRLRDLMLAGLIGVVAFLLIVNDTNDSRLLVENARYSRLLAIATAAATILGAIAMAYLPGMAGWPRAFPVAVTLIVVVSSFIPKPYGLELFRTRNVYGVLTALETSDRRFTMLLHGSTLHGMQFSQRNNAGELVPIAPRTPLTYFHVQGPIGYVFRALNSTGCPLHVGIIGLGAGSLAAYAKAGDNFEFFEIDPGVVSAAQGPHFSFLAAGRQRGANISVIEGDGRRSLAKRNGAPFDLLILDAFSSDSIPAHLLTLESFKTAERQLKPGGYIVFHTSNRHFAINEVVAANADRLGWRHLEQGGLPASRPIGAMASQWVIVRPSAAPAANTCAVDLMGNTVQSAATSAVWTDDFSNPLGVIKAQGLWNQLRGTTEPVGDPNAPSGPAQSPSQ